MNLRQIEVFRAVMLAGSVTAAARLLHVSQPGISRMLAHIELQLGVKLFDRANNKLHPRPEAQALYASVEQVYRGVQRIDDVAHQLKDGLGMQLRIAASPSVSLEVVPRAIAALGLRFPQARIYVETLLARDMVAQLATGQADIGICTAAIDNALLRTETVGEWNLVCAFRADHELARHQAIRAEDLAGERLIRFGPETPQGQWMARWCAANPHLALAGVEVRSGQLACSLAGCGMGVAVVDNLTARAWRSHSLVFRPIVDAPSHRVVAARGENAPASMLLESLVELVRSGLACG